MTLELEKVLKMRNVQKLQSDLHEIYKWVMDNNMSLNEHKFELLRYGKNMEIKQSTHYKTDTNANIIEKSVVKDLGVFMANNAKFNDHIDNVAVKANHMTSWILRTFESRNPELMLTLWKSLIIPIFDYCSQLYHPSKVGYIQKLEIIQRSFIRKITGMHKFTYWEQLKLLKVSSLERRRERYCIIYIWKILEGVVPNIEGKFRVQEKINHRRGRLCFLHSLERSSFQQLRQATLPVQGIKLFNAMPKHIRNLRKVETDVFKRSLDRFLSNVLDEPQIPGYTQYRRHENNSIIEMIKFVKKNRTEWWRFKDFGQDE